MTERYTIQQLPFGCVIWDQQFHVPVRTTETEYDAHVLCDAFNEDG